MRILVVGASGRLGSAVVSALEDRHELVTASRSSGDHIVDLRNPATIASLYASVGPVDAVACTAGKTPYAALDELSSDQFAEGVRDKLLGQIELVRQGARHLRDGGSFTLVSGVLGVDPIRTGAVASTVNGGIDSFVRAAAIELPRGLRVNAVSATVFAEAWDVYGSLFPGFKPVPVADAASRVREVDRGRAHRPGVPGRLLTLCSGVVPAALASLQRSQTARIPGRPGIPRRPSPQPARAGPKWRRRGRPRRGRAPAEDLVGLLVGVVGGDPAVGLGQLQDAVDAVGVDEVAHRRSSNEVVGVGVQAPASGGRQRAADVEHVSGDLTVDRHLGEVRRLGGDVLGQPLLEPRRRAEQRPQHQVVGQLVAQYVGVLGDGGRSLGVDLDPDAREACVPPAR